MIGTFLHVHLQNSRTCRICPVWIIPAVIEIANNSVKYPILSTITTVDSNLKVGWIQFCCNRVSILGPIIPDGIKTFSRTISRSILKTSHWLCIGYTKRSGINVSSILGNDCVTIVVNIPETSCYHFISSIPHCHDGIIATYLGECNLSLLMGGQPNLVIRSSSNLTGYRLITILIVVSNIKGIGLFFQTTYTYSDRILTSIICIVNLHRLISVRPGDDAFLNRGVDGCCPLQQHPVVSYLGNKTC